MISKNWELQYHKWGSYQSLITEGIHLWNCLNTTKWQFESVYSETATQRKEPIKKVLEKYDKIHLL